MGDLAVDVLVRSLAANLAKVEDQVKNWRLTKPEQHRFLKWRERFPGLETPAFDVVAETEGTIQSWTSLRGKGWLRLADNYPLVEIGIYSKGRERLRSVEEYDDFIRLAGAIMERLAKVAEDLDGVRNVIPPSFVLQAREAMGDLMKAWNRVDRFLRAFEPEGPDNAERALQGKGG